MNKNPLIAEKIKIRDVLILALPMVLSHASETIMLFVDRLFLSNLGKIFLTGATSGGITQFNVLSLFLGVLGYVNAIVAQHYGANKKHSCARATAQGIRLSFISWPLLMLSIPLVKMIFIRIGHSPEQLELEMTYFRILIFASILLLLRTVLSGFFIGLGKTSVVMFANIIGLLVNIPVNYVLIFGKLGFPALGIAGAALGTVIGSFVILLILLGVYLSKKYRQEYGTSQERGFDKILMRKLLQFGTPAGIEIFLNITAFNFFIQLMYSYGTNIAAAVTITFNYDMVAFIPMIGLSFAATALSGRYMGAGNPDEAARSTWLTLHVAWVYAFIMMIIFLVGAKPLVALFASNFAGGSIDVAPTAEIMLRLAALYTLADATQLIFAGGLRGAGDTKFVMLISAGLHWLFALLALVFIKKFHFSPISMWIFFIVFVFLLGIGMYLRFRSGKWRSMSLVERDPEEPLAPNLPVVAEDILI